MAIDPGQFLDRFDDGVRPLEAVEEAGMPVIQGGDFGGTLYWYFDTTDVLNGDIAPLPRTATVATTA